MSSKVIWYGISGFWLHLVDDPYLCRPYIFYVVVGVFVTLYEKENFLTTVFDKRRESIGTTSRKYWHHIQKVLAPPPEITEKGKVRERGDCLLSKPEVALDY